MIGLNEWADANRIVVLYPQAHATTLSELPSGLLRFGPSAPNPMGCWNWWGYAGDSRYLTKKGVQVDAIWQMIGRLEGESVPWRYGVPPSPFTARLEERCRPSEGHRDDAGKAPRSVL